MYIHERPDGEPVARLDADLVINAQHVYVCPSCQSETHGHGGTFGDEVWTCLCSGCGMRFRHEYTEVLFWPSLIPEGDRSPEPKSNIEKLIDDLNTINTVKDQIDRGRTHHDSCYLRALKSFEKRLRKVIREEIDGLPLSSVPAKLGKRLLDLPEVVRHQGTRRQ